MNLKYLSAFLLSFCLVLVACDDEDDYSISTKNTITEVTTGSASVTATSAIVTGVVKDLSNAASASYSVGAYYSTEEDPTINGTKQTGSIDGSGNVTTEITDLTPGTTYYYATFVTLQSTVTTFGNVQSFVATDMTVTTGDASDVSCCKANITGSATNADVDYTLCVKYSLTESDVINGKEVEVGEIAGLLPNTTYYYVVCAKIGDSNGYVMGNTKSLTTQVQTLEFVDLGANIAWATTNIGAETESEVGALIGYGDITAMKTSTSASGYPSDDIAGTSDYDVAMNCFSGAKTPTVAQIASLISNTTQKWDVVDGVSGIRFTAKAEDNDNSIFLPVAGYREGDEIKDEEAGYYWSGNVYSNDNTYAQTLHFVEGGTVEAGLSARYLGLSIRPVQGSASMNVSNEGLPYGNLEGKNDFRIELYNIYGSTSEMENPPVNPTDVVFAKNMAVTFTIKGLDENLKETGDIKVYDENGNHVSMTSNVTRPDYFVAGLQFTNDGWWPAYWSDMESGTNFVKYDAPITGDGTYVVWVDVEKTGGACDNAMVFCVDIKNLSCFINDEDAVSVTVDAITLDGSMEQKINADLVEFNNKDGDGENGRIEIYNEYGNSGSTANGWYNEILSFYGMMIVDFSLEGIDRNLVSGAAGSYQTQLSFADADWEPAFWGEYDYGDTYVTGDGNYQVMANMNGLCEGAVCWTIEIYGLWKDLTDPYAVKAKIDKVTLPGKQ